MVVLVDANCGTVESSRGYKTVILTISYVILDAHCRAGSLIDSAAYAATGFAVLFVNLGPVVMGTTFQRIDKGSAPISCVDDCGSLYGRKVWKESHIVIVVHDRFATA
jgi:hypothetical protein